MNQVICVWLNYPNNIYSNRVFSIYVADLYINEDPFQNETPCWARSTQCSASIASK